jgi:hypothetical protein
MMARDVSGFLPNLARWPTVRRDFEGGHLTFASRRS